jgi:hypothetical protein
MAVWTWMAAGWSRRGGATVYRDGVARVRPGWCCDRLKARAHGRKRLHGRRLKKRV